MTKRLEEYTREELLDEVKRLKQRKKFGLVWEDKNEKVVEDCQVRLPVLSELQEYAIINNPSSPTHLLIEGDNYHSLSALNYTHAGEVDVIYIDPPYNTGNKDFIYNDSFIEREDSYRHSKWLSFMSKRLSLAKTLLKDDGVMFISIDDNEQAHLRLLADQIFGENNFVSTLHVEMSTTQGMKVKSAQRGNIVKNAEYILIYTKNGRKNIAKNILYDYRPTYDTHYSYYLNDDSSIVSVKEKFAETYPDENIGKIDEAYADNPLFRNFVDTQISNIFRYDKTTGFNASDFVTNQVYTVERGGRSYTLKSNGRSVDQLMFLSSSFGPTDDFRSKIGMRKIRGDWWKDFYLDMGNVSKEGNVVFANGKKPVRLIKQLLKMSTNKDACVLDFFAGSGTTGQAVIDLNHEDGGSRRFLLCTTGVEKEIENINIALSITHKRIGNVIKSQNVRYFVTDFVDKQKSTDGTRAALVERCADMIRIRESCFEQINDTSTHKFYANADKFVAVIFDPSVIASIWKELETTNTNDLPVSLYVFSYSQYAYEDEIPQTHLAYKVIPIPESILKVYQRIFRKQEADNV